MSATRPPISVRAALEAVFNGFALNLLLVLSCLPVITAPLGLRAAVITLDRWRAGDDDRRLRVYFHALAGGPWLAPWLAVAGPCLATALAYEEVHYFASRPAVVNAVCLGLGVLGLALALVTLSYTLLLSARQPTARPTDVWSEAIALAAANLRGPSPLILAVSVISAVLLMADPAIAVIGFPLGALFVLRAAASWAISGSARPGVRAIHTHEPTVQKEEVS